MPRPPARRGRRPKVTEAPRPVTVRGNRRPNDNDDMGVIIPKPSREPRLDECDGHAAGLDEDRMEDLHATPSIHREELVINNESHLTMSKHQTPMSKHQNSADGSMLVLSSAAGKAFVSNLPHRGDTSSRIQKTGTPAFESSMLSNFRRRPRQPSILQMMQGDPSSDLDEDDFLGTFDPDDESTPLKFPNRKSIPQLPISSPSSTPHNLPTGSSKKRKLYTEPEVQVSGSPEPFGLVIASDQSFERTGSEDDLLPTPRRAQPVDAPEIMSQTMMPPMSSPVSSAEKQPPDAARCDDTKGTNRLRRNRTVSEKGRPLVCNAGPRISTATLRENLLPQRRLRRRCQKLNYGDGRISDDLESESEYYGAFEADQDELSYSTSRVPKRQKCTAGSKTNSNNKRADIAKDIPGRKRRKPAPKSTNIQPSKNSQPPSSKGGGITYSSRRSYVSFKDKENQPIHATSTSMSESEEPFVAADVLPSVSKGMLLSDELVQQARKFAEISKWSLEFEDATSASLSQSSPFR
ncbi:hypothetical protein AJ79_09019 [Helicocarpus griseus UAMH5409]|uniref:Uncharacterized protein n=1 Tax=Helicocarpus griseus UAMH5409 TaxID=1447875 RepID=A0A2B7WMT8_9EURO|nr:hypothetical protein AJ79_09019 [Helicocarpus griseus UAMH5409]